MRTVIIDTETCRAAIKIEGGFDNLSQFGLSLLVVGVPTSGEKIDDLAYSPYADLTHFPSLDFVDQQHIQTLLDQANEVPHHLRFLSSNNQHRQDRSHQ